MKKILLALVNVNTHGVGFFLMRLEPRGLRIKWAN